MPPDCQTDDMENDDLEQLLKAAEEVEKINPTVNTNTNGTPRLREDPSFGKDFGIFNSGNTLNPVNINITNTTKSVVQNEDLDSSDDEDVRNFLERKYNEYGRDINKQLKQQDEENKEVKITREIDKSITQGFSNTLVKSIGKSKIQTTLTQSFTAKPKANLAFIKKTEPVSNVYTDPIFGLRLINPLVSSSVLIERMSGRTPVSMPGLAFHIERGDLSKDWVVAGAILSKSPVKTTKKGASYSIWKVSDLKGEIKIISLFLFKNAYKELWKTAIGTVIAILNPTVFEKREERNDVASLSIDSPQKVMILGQSKDMGTCKSRKKNGEPCGSLVNLSDCEYCVYHIKQEFGKMSKRSELQSSTAGRGLNELRNKVLGKNEVFYGGQSYTAIPAKKNAKQTAKDDKRLMTLSEYYQSPNAGSVNHISKPKGIKDIPYASKVGPISKIASTVESSSKQRLKDLERLKILKGTEETAVSISIPDNATPSSNVPEKYQNKEFSFTQKTPTLSQGTFSIELNCGKKQAELSKLRAIQAIRKKPIVKSDPNFIKYRGTAQGKKRAIDELNDMQESEAKKQKVEEQERKSRIQKIIDATSSHTNLVKSRENEEQEKYFNKLEKKEALEEKMLSTYKIPCKAVICLKCKYTSFSAADRCKEEKHSLKVVDAEKRFFQCEDCGNRTATVHKIPKLSCKNCSGSRWRRSAMIRERKIDNISGHLSIRGDEEKFFGSLNSSANLNLLVPEE